MTGTALSCTRKSAISTVFYRNAPDLPFHLAFLTGLLCRTPAAAAAYLAAFCGMSKSTIAAALTIRCCSTVASQQIYLAFDYTQSFHTGAEMEGLSRGNLRRELSGW